MSRFLAPSECIPNPVMRALDPLIMSAGVAVFLAVFVARCALKPVADLVDWLGQKLPW